MRFFSELGACVDDAWRSADYDEEAFPDLAARCLERLRPSDHVGMMDIIQWVHSRRSFSRQTTFGRKFGQPPVSVFQATHFYIEVLFWTDSTTTIHQHAFSGAFHVLQGSSIHSRYDFESTKRYNDRLFLGKLAARQIERLEQGAVRPIRAGAGTIHALFHLDHPSISVVVRTHKSALRGPQLVYNLPGIAHDPFYTNESLYVRQQTLRLLHGLKHPEFRETSIRAIRESDALEAFLLLHDLSAVIASPDELGDLLAAVAPAHDELARNVRAMATGLRRERVIIALRATVQRREHRFLLALLLNVRSREEVLRLVAEAYPGMPPVDRIVSWIQELGAMTVHHPVTGARSSLLGVRSDETALVLLRHLLSGASTRQVISRVREEFDEADVDLQEEELFAACQAYRASILFADLLAGSPA